MPLQGLRLLARVRVPHARKRKWERSPLLLSNLPHSSLLPRQPATMPTSEFSPSSPATLPSADEEGEKPKNRKKWRRAGRVTAMAREERAERKERGED